MRHAVDDVVDRELVRFVGRSRVVQVLARPLDVVADVDVVVDYDRQRRRGSLLFVDAEELAHQPLLPEPAGIGHLERIDPEKSVENRMREVQALDPRIGQRRAASRLRNVPLVRKMKIVDDEEPALAQVVAEARTSARWETSSPARKDRRSGTSAAPGRRRCGRCSRSHSVAAP